MDHSSTSDVIKTLAEHSIPSFEFVKTVLNFLGMIAWPLVIFILFRYFSESLRNLLASFSEVISERGIKVSSSGVEVTPPTTFENIGDFLNAPSPLPHPTSTPKPERLEQPLKDSQNKALSPHDWGLVQETLEAIQRHLQSKSDKGLSQEDALTALLCDAYIFLYFERCFQRILGSQLKLLLSIQEQPIPESSARKFFEKKMPYQELISFAEWMGFLEKSRLVKRSSETGEEKFSLSDEGKEFIRYIKQRGYSLQKAG